MRSRKVLLGLACLAANTMVLNSTAHADRRTGLGGNLLIEDKKDIFPFPQYTLKYRNMVNVDYGGTGSTGQGFLTLGDENKAFGIALHRGDLLSPDTVGFASELTWINGVQNPFTLGAFNRDLTPKPNPNGPATFVDLFGALSLGGDNSLGARVGFGRAATLGFVDGDASGGSQTFITAEVGYSHLPATGLRLDLEGNIVLALANAKAADKDTNNGNNFRFGGLARAFYPINDVLDLGFIANLAVQNEHVKNETPPKPATNDFTVGLMAGAGPSIHVDRASIAAYGGFLLKYGMLEPDSKTDDDDESNLQFVVPDVRLSAEVQLLDWLYVRTGVDYAWNMVSNYYSKANVNGDNPANGTGQDGKTRTSSSAYAWNTGLGVQKGNFNLDGVITNTFMTNGPAFIGGGTPGFLAIASLTYRFGDVFSGGAVAPAQEQTAPVVEPAPEPVPEAPVEPAPAPEAPVEPAPAQETVAPPAAGASGAATGTGVSGSASGGINIGR